jgi:imidazolonepropionase-like amidohydrolase
LRGITAFAADALLVEGRVGRLKVGLDADFAAWTGDPIDPRSSVTQVWIDGERVYDATEERRF